MILNEARGIECKCGGCGKTIKPKHIRETISGFSEGQFFTKTLCEKCLKEVVEEFRAYLKKKEDEEAKKTNGSGADQNSVCV